MEGKRCPHARLIRTHAHTHTNTHTDTLTESELQAAGFVCAPSIIIPGAFKSATSSLFAAIAQHPQVLRVRTSTAYIDASLVVKSS
jgi:hypothetical protein